MFSGDRSEDKTVIIICWTFISRNGWQLRNAVDVGVRCCWRCLLVFVDVTVYRWRSPFGIIDVSASRIYVRGLSAFMT